jgi:hypothetical protein
MTPQMETLRRVLSKEINGRMVAFGVIHSFNYRTIVLHRQGSFFGGMRIRFRD